MKESKQQKSLTRKRPPGANKKGKLYAMRNEDREIIREELMNSVVEKENLEKKSSPHLIAHRHLDKKGKFINVKRVDWKDRNTDKLLLLRLYALFYLLKHPEFDFNSKEQMFHPTCKEKGCVPHWLVAPKAKNRKNVPFDQYTPEMREFADDYITKGLQILENGCYHFLPQGVMGRNEVNCLGHCEPAKHFIHRWKTGIEKPSKDHRLCRLCLDPDCCRPRAFRMENQSEANQIQIQRGTRKIGDRAPPPSTQINNI